MGKKFDMGEFAKTLQQANVSESDTWREQIEYIDIDLLDGDSRNFYDLTGIDDLAANIQVCGLQQPIRVRRGENGRYIIVSGHRRRAALRKLAEDGQDQYKQVPCIVERDDIPPAMQELRLIWANSSTREMSSAEKGKQAQRVRTLLYQLQDEGYEFKGRMRDHVAAACQISQTKLAVLDVIQAKLIPAYKTLYEQDQITESAAYALARMPSPFQEKVFAACKKNVQGNAAEKMRKKLDAGWTGPDTSLRCPDQVHLCTHEAAFLRHDLARCWGQCWGATCCMECREAFQEYSPCSSACQKAKAERSQKNKAKMEREKTSAKREAEERTKQNQAVADDVAALWQRLQEAAGGHLDSKLMKALGFPHRPHAVEAMLKGEFHASPWDDGSSCYPTADGLSRFCRETGASADELLLLRPAQAPQPEGQLVLAGWMPGGTRPGHSGRVVCLFDLGKEDLVGKIMRYDSRRGKYLWESSGTVCDMEPTAWMALPAYEGGKRNAEN